MDELQTQEVEDLVKDLEDESGMEATATTLRQRPGADVRMDTPGTHAKMLKEVRSWGLWLLGIGVLSLFLSGLSGAWGIVLLIAGLASFVFREAVMFVIYGIILAWAGLSNLLSGQLGWIVFALLQFVLAYSVFRKYTQYRRAEAGPDSAPGPQRASRAFPQIGCALGALAFLGLVLIFFAGVIFFGVTGGNEVPPLLVWLESVVAGLAVLGLAVAVASLLSGYRYKAMAVLGLLGSASVLLLELLLALLP